MNFADFTTHMSRQFKPRVSYPAHETAQAVVITGCPKNFPVDLFEGVIFSPSENNTSKVVPFTMFGETAGEIRSYVMDHLVEYYDPTVIHLCYLFDTNWGLYGSSDGASPQSWFHFTPSFEQLPEFTSIVNAWQMPGAIDVIIPCLPGHIISNHGKTPGYKIIRIQEPGTLLAPIDVLNNLYSAIRNYTMNQDRLIDELEERTL